MNNSDSNFAEDVFEPDQENFIGRALVKLQIRLESVEVKVNSLTKIVRLLQQYSEKKDLQYQKQTHNMEIFDSKLSKIDNIHSQIVQSSQRYEQITKKFNSYSLKLEQITKNSREKQNTSHQVEQKLNFQLEEVNRKIQGLQSTMLKNIRENHSNQEQPNYNYHQNYHFQELAFRVNQLQEKLQTDYDRIRCKVDRIGNRQRKKLIQADDSYGLGTQRSRKSTKKAKEKENSGLKRLKSR